MEALPKIVRQRLQAGARPGGHPHADLLTAFAEKALTERERTRVVEHLSRCEDCREVVFLSAPQRDPVQIGERIANRGGWLSWPALRWGTAVACMVVVGTAVTLFHEGSHHSDLMERAVNESARPAAHAAPAPAIITSPNQSVPAEKRSEPAPARKNTSQDSLMARAEAPARPSAKPMTAAPRMPMQFDQSREINGNNIEATRSLSGGDASNMAAAPTSARLSKDENLADQPERDKKQVSASASGAADARGSANEAVAVQANSGLVQVESESAPAAKSKESPSTDSRLNGASFGKTIGGPIRPDLADAAKMKTESTSATLVPRWKLTPAGTLQRSLDAGANWENIPVAGAITFQAFAALLADVWVGGANGVLYHSSDAGLHWAQVIPKSNHQSLSGGIGQIEFSDVQNGKITTVSGEVWTTADAGKNWRKN